MIFVDTSVWVEFLRGRNKHIITVLSDLLDNNKVALSAAVWVEIMVGASNTQRPILKRVFSALPVFFPQNSCWDLILSWIETAASKGQRFGFADLLIAATVRENKGQLWSLDNDFQRMAALKFVELSGADLS